MQIKTVKNVIHKKMTEWIKSIKDTSLREDLKPNIMVSGGSITSLLLNDDVNDYDVYIKDINVLKRLVEYYARSSDSVTVLDGRYRQLYIDEMKNAYSAENEEDVFNAYSISIQNLKDDQIKLFFGGQAGVKVNETVKEENLNYDPLFLSPNAISLSDKLQIVIRFHGDNEQIHKTFDFMHATNYFTFEDGLVTNIDALESIVTKQLRYQGSLYPLTSIIRMKKFLKRGWNINAGEILKIMFQISELNLKDPNVLEEQLIGVDVAYFNTLVQILRGTDTKTITSAYLNKIIDRVFNSSEENI